MRGQLFSFDFLISISLILFVFATALAISDFTASTINGAEEQRELKIAAASALSQLLETPGNPANWDHLEFADAGVESLGLASGRNELDFEKTVKFFAIANSNIENHVLAKRLLALDYPGADFYLSIQNTTDSLLLETSFRPMASGEVFSGQRVGLLKGEPVRVTLKLWVEK